MSALSKALQSVKGWLSGGGIEGSNRGPFYGVGEQGNSFLLGSMEDGWQRNIVRPYFDHTKVSIVYACVQAYSRAISTCVASHIQRDDKGKHTIAENTWPARLIRNPNSYETTNQFFYNIVSEIGFRGASLVTFVRDNRNIPIAMHRIPYGTWAIHVEPETREIFYGVSSNSNSLSPTTSPDYLIPAREVIHFRQHTPRHPLIGESPVTAAALAVGINVSLSESQAAFFTQMRRPSGVLTTDQPLTKDQITRLREAFDENAKRWAQGGMPILSNGLKFQAMSISSQDAQLIDAQKMSLTDVCRVYAIPPPVVAIMENATFSNSELLINFWLSTGLGSMLENLEQSLNKAFGFTPMEYINFDTQSLLRSDAKSKIDTLGKGVISAIYSPNEARNMMNLPPIAGGDAVYLQQQNAPISRLDEYFAGVIANQHRAATASSSTAADNSPSNSDNTPAADDNATPSKDIKETIKEVVDELPPSEFIVDAQLKRFDDSADGAKRIIEMLLKNSDNSASAEAKKDEVPPNV